MTSIIPVILSGGSGTRLWPLSREHYPKQLLALAGNQTLLQETAGRVNGLEHCMSPVIVCNEDHRFLVAEQLRQINCTPSAILLEPQGRNTAPALTLAAMFVPDPDDIMLVMPADHVIRDHEAFLAAVRCGDQAARNGRMVTFGIVPDRAETGYGYIKKGKQDNDSAVYVVDRFVEKPDAQNAQRYCQSGDYLWNSGIFMMSAALWLNEIRRFRPDIHQAVEAAAKTASRDLDFTRVSGQDFERCPGESIDYAVMEKSENVVVVPLEAGWSDIGAWSAYWEITPHDPQGNAVHGDVLIKDCSNSLVLSQDRFVAALGLHDLVVVDTSDALLVAHRDSAQKVKDIVATLKKQKRSEHLMHRKVYRPWGHYEGVDAGERFQVKRITVNPGAALSLQMHHHRAEHWIVVKGTARVTRGEEVFVVSENQSTFIPLGVRHRLENPGTISLEIIEVQSGSYLGEDDIVRFEDRYHRE